VVTSDREYWNKRPEYEKIIATTDTSIVLYAAETLASASGFSLKTDEILLPSIPQQFIKYFIDEYNKGRIIKQVEVELEYERSLVYNRLHGQEEKVAEKLKLNHQNEISIVMDNNSPEDFSDDSSSPKEQKVDFEMLKSNIADIIQLLQESSVKDEEINNLELFFKFLSTKPTFAKKAYEELSKLNK
jgi:hypothetical protein